MAEILIRQIDEKTEALLKQRAARRGKSLEADLRETLEQLAHQEPGGEDHDQPFGSWLVSLSRPGIDLDEALAQVRSSPARPVAFD